LPEVFDRLFSSYPYPILGTKGSPWELWMGSWVTSIHDECDGSDADTLWDGWCSWGCNHTHFFSVFIFKVFVVVKALSGKLIDIADHWENYVLLRKLSVGILLLWLWIHSKRWVVALKGIMTLCSYRLRRLDISCLQRIMN
jgi:hypothetical protein